MEVADEGTNAGEAVGVEGSCKALMNASLRCLTLSSFSAPTTGVKAAWASAKRSLAS